MNEVGQPSLSMQKIILSFLVFFSLNTFSQNKKFDPNADQENFFRVGAKAGVNINKINGQSYKSGFNYQAGSSKEAEIVEVLTKV